MRQIASLDGAEADYSLRPLLLFRALCDQLANNKEAALSEMPPQIVVNGFL